MKQRNHFNLLLLLMLLIVVAAAGCGLSKPEADVIDHPAPSTPVTADAQPVIDHQPAEQPKAPAAVSKPKEDQVSLASNEDLSGEEAPPASSKPKVKPSTPDYSPEKPSLLGMQLNMKSSEIIELFGNPASLFVIEEDTTPVTVYDYEEFMVGFTANNALEFIDIRSTEIDPGLKGLKLGDSIQTAIRLLGTPDTNTTYVVTYKSGGSVLKLDVEPESQMILSIKLFSE